MSHKIKKCVCGISIYSCRCIGVHAIEIVSPCTHKESITEVEVYKLKISFHTERLNSLLLRDEFGVWTLSGVDYSIRGSIFEGEICMALEKMRECSSLMEKIK
jgi:hypothetical protein